jgi:D-alanyl-D-alanine carboxypeptidase
MQGTRCQQPDTRLREIHLELGIPENWAEARNVEYYREAAVSDLQVVLIDFDGKPFILHRAVVPKWNALVAAAEADGVVLNPFSGFRSYLYQRMLIRSQLKRGRTLEDVLTSLAAPGCSEHHTGRAMDLTAEGCPPLGEEFEKTQAFTWLSEHGKRFDLVMSFPRNNPHGYIYEPWHWCFSS